MLTFGTVAEDLPVRIKPYSKSIQPIIPKIMTPLKAPEQQSFFTYSRKRATQQPQPRPVVTAQPTEEDKTKYVLPAIIGGLLFLNVLS